MNYWLFLIDWRERNGLTRAEDLSLLVDMMRSDLQSAIVSERRTDRAD